MKIIAIEGCDGAGKGVQFTYLTNKLAALGKKCAALSFPEYDGFFGKEIGSMLSGKNDARADKVDAKSMALWYAMDRADTFKRIDLTDCEYLILNRYTLSNAVYQSLRIKRGKHYEKKQKAFAEWVFALEHDMLCLPRPDLYLILDVDNAISQINVSKKGFRKYVGNAADVYEKEEYLLQNVRRTYKYFAEKKLSVDKMKVIQCIENAEMLPPQQIHDAIFGVLKTEGII